MTTICPGFITIGIIGTVRISSGTSRRSLKELLALMDGIYKWCDYTPDRVAEVVLKAVEVNRGIAPMTPEAYLYGFIYRLSRRALGFVNRYNMRLFCKGLLARDLESVSTPGVAALSGRRNGFQGQAASAEYGNFFPGEHRPGNRKDADLRVLEQVYLDLSPRGLILFFRFLPGALFPGFPFRLALLRLGRF